MLRAVHEGPHFRHAVKNRTWRNIDEDHSPYPRWRRGSDSHAHRGPRGSAHENRRAADLLNHSLDVGAKDFRGIRTIRRPIAIAMSAQIQGNAAKAASGRFEHGIAPTVSGLSAAVQEEYRYAIYRSGGARGEIDGHALEIQSFLCFHRQTLGTFVKPDPRRFDLSLYPHQVEVHTRFSDIDPLWHLNNVRLLELYQEARSSFNLAIWEASNLDRRKHRVLVARQSIDYLDEVEWPGPVTIGVGVAHIGSKSYSIGLAMFQQARCVGVSNTVLVYMTEDGSAPLPEEVRAALKSKMLPIPVEF